MPSLLYKRSEATYKFTGPTVRAALDFATKSRFFDFGPDYRGRAVDELRELAIALFEDRKVTSVSFSFVSPERENCRQPFLIIFAPLANGFAPKLEIEIKSVAALRAQAKLYKSDATAYAVARKPKAPVVAKSNWDKPGRAI